MKKINLYILNPSNISKKHILENKIQQIFYKDKEYNLIYIPSLFSSFNFFNKFFSIKEYFKNKEIPENSFYMDHDIFINDKKFILNMYKNKIFLTYKKRQFFNWEKIFKEKIKIDIKSTFTHRDYSCFFPLYNTIFKMFEEIDILWKDHKKNLIEYSGLIEEWFFTKYILDFNYKTYPIEFNQLNERIYIIHYQISDKFKLQFKKDLKLLINNFRELENVYKNKEK